MKIFFSVAAAATLSGCVLIEALVGLAEQFEGQPQAYAAVVNRVEDGSNLYSIFRVIIAENREGRAEDVRFEALREVHVRLPAARFPGRFEDMSLRPDGARLAAVVEERLPDTTEYHAIVTDTARDRVVMSPTDNIMLVDYINTCGVPAFFEDILRQEVAVFADPPVDPQAELEIRWRPSEVRLGEFPVGFVGWTDAGAAVFEVAVRLQAEVRVDGRPVTDDRGRTLWTLPVEDLGRVVYDADTGRAVGCDGSVVTLPAPRYVIRIRPQAGGAVFDVTPPDGGDFPLYGLDARRFRIAGRVDLVVPPY